MVNSRSFAYKLITPTFC